MPILVQKPLARAEEPPYEPSPAEIIAAITGAAPSRTDTDFARVVGTRASDRKDAPVLEFVDDGPAPEAVQFERPVHEDTTPDDYEPHREDLQLESPRPVRARRDSRSRNDEVAIEREPRARRTAPEQEPEPRTRRAEPEQDRAPRARRSEAEQEQESEPREPRSRKPSPPVPGTKVPEAKIPLPEKFRALGVNETGLAAMASLGFDTPSPIQALAIPLLLQGGDVVGLAQTGTGKTIAFGIPLAAAVDPMDPNLQALVLVPTRELARQVSETLEHLGLFHGFSVVTLTGGTRVAGDIQKLQRGAQVMVGTPGRVIDHIKRGNLPLGNIKFAVLDEADEMLDIGFARDIDYILRSVPKDRQSALFSATMPESIRRLVWRYLRNSQEVSVEPERRTAENVTQLYCEVAVRDKTAALMHLHRTLDLGRSLIFRKMKIGVDRLTQQLQNAGVSARAIHGDLAQSERDSVLAGFKRGEIQFLVATNVAARGLDIPDVQHVINFDVPQNAEEYIHRIGRTARAGKAGSAVTFVGEWEIQEWDKIRSEVGGAEMNRLELPRHL